MNKKYLFMASVFAITAITSTPAVQAKGTGGHASGGHTSGGGRSVGGSRSTGGASRSVARTAPTSRTSVGSRSFTRSGSQSSKAQRSATASKSYRNLSSNARVLNLSRQNNYTNYAKNPYGASYRRNNQFSNVYFNYWLFSHSWTHQQQLIAKQIGISQSDAQKLYQSSKHVTITNDGEKQLVIVTQKQYDKINIGDKLEVKNNKLFANGKAI